MKRCAKILYAFICSLLLAAASPSAGWAQPHVLVNAGGGAYKDNLGRNWLADTWFNTSIDGTRYSKNAIANTTWDYLYQTERWSPQLAYQIPLTNGSYTITLHFAEIVYGGAGRRVFSVASEGQQVISNLDIYKEAGKNKALLKTFSTQVNDGFWI